MNQDHGRGVDVQRPLHNQLRVDGRTVDGALEQLLEGDNPVPIVQLC